MGLVLVRFPYLGFRTVVVVHLYVCVCGLFSLERCLGGIFLSHSMPSAASDLLLALDIVFPYGLRMVLRSLPKTQDHFVQARFFFVSCLLFLALGAIVLLSCCFGPLGAFVFACSLWWWLKKTPWSESYRPAAPSGRASSFLLGEEKPVNTSILLRCSFWKE